jgi:hypothetical protein
LCQRYLRILQPQATKQQRKYRDDK